MINHSGIGTFIKNMIPGLIQNYDLSLLGNPEVLNAFSWSRESRIIEVTSSIYSLKEQLELPAKIPHCDLFISPHYNIPILKIKALKRAVIIHDVNHLVFTDQHAVYKKAYAQYMINAAIRKSNKIITDSEFSKNEINKYANTQGKDLRVVYCGLNIDEYKYHLHSQSIDKIKKNYNITKDYFLYVGSIKPHKNLKAAVKAFNLWLSKFKGNKSLVIVGVKHEDLVKDPEVYNLIDNLHTVVTGYIKDNDLPLIYSNATCLIFPSFYEGFGLPPLEAMICGCPVLASNSASIPEACGDAAIYFDPFNFEELTDKMKLISENANLRAELVNKGHKNILKFSDEKFLGNLKLEFEDVLTKN
jgi:glycosyltransferase involved in cell wall biosynthesis